jgi:malate dehydrogenase
MPKVSIIGAGNVGATAAFKIATEHIADVVILDILEGISLGKTRDIQDAVALSANAQEPAKSCEVLGAADYGKISGSDIVVITAGLARRPGMERKDLLEKNSKILREVALKIKKFCPQAISIIVTNPLDIMTYLAYKTIEAGPRRILGMSGLLDAARFSHFISLELNVPPEEINALVIGEHGNSMLPLARFTKVKGQPLCQIISKEKIDDIIERTRRRGAEIVRLLGNSSAYFAPSLAIYEMVKAILNDEKKVLCASVFLDGQYGLSDICIGVPIRLGRNGVEEIIKLELNQEEKTVFYKSAESIRKEISTLEHSSM